MKYPKKYRKALAAALAAMMIFSTETTSFAVGAGGSSGGRNVSSSATPSDAEPSEKPDDKPEKPDSDLPDKDQGGAQTDEPSPDSSSDTESEDKPSSATPPNAERPDEDLEADDSEEDEENGEEPEEEEPDEELEESELETQESQEKLLEDVQNLLEGLPMADSLDVEAMTQDEISELESELEQLEEKLSELTKEDLESLDLSNYEALKELLDLGRTLAENSLFTDGVASVSTGDELIAAFQEIKEAPQGSEFTIELSKNIEIKGSHTLDIGWEKQVHLLGRGHKLTYEDADTVIQVSSGGELYLGNEDGDKLILDTGLFVENRKKPLLQITDGTGYMYEGVTLRENKNTYSSNGSAGGVNVAGGTFYMYGGEISRCTSWVKTSGVNGGGGVNVCGSRDNSTGTFYMEGGSIKGNKAYNYGGGVLVQAECVFEMTGGSISGNSTSNETSSGRGGGIYNQGTAVISGGEITGNTADSSKTKYPACGGGIATYKKGTTTISGDVAVTGNTAHKGGGIAVLEGGTTEIKAGVTCSGNTGKTSDPDFYKDSMSTLVVPGIFDDAGKAAVSTEEELRAAFEDINLAGSDKTEFTICLESDITLKEAEPLKITSQQKTAVILGQGHSLIYENPSVFLGASASEAGLILGAEDGSDALTLTAKGAKRNAPLLTVDKASKSELILNEGVALEENTNTAGPGAVDVKEGIFRMKGGEIAGCVSESGQGGGVRVGMSSLDDAYFYMEGGVIRNNRSSLSDSGTARGGGVYVGVNSACLEITDGQILDNTAENTGSGKAYGGGINVHGAKSVKITDSQITGNKAESAAGTGYGGGYCQSESVSGRDETTGKTGAQLIGTEISGNTADYGGGVAGLLGDIYADQPVSQNTANVQDDNVYVERGNVEIPEEEVFVDGSHEAHISTESQLLKAIEEVNDAQEGEFTLYLDADITGIDESWTKLTLEKNELTILGCGHTISYASQNSIGVSGESTLNLGASDGSDTLIITVDEGKSIPDPLLSVNGNGVLNMYDGVSLTGNIDTSSDPGGVDVQKGTFNMYGGEISDNKAYFGNGAGVRVLSGGIFHMYGGKIADNQLIPDLINEGKTRGGGVYILEGTFYMHGGIISGNEAKNYGGGVMVDQGTMHMSGGEISGNKCENYGGGICNYFGTLTVTGGTVKENQAENGGGICAYVVNGNPSYPGTMSIEGAEITGNQAENGGGIFAYSSETEIGACQIKGNTANWGGGLYSYQSKTVLGDKTEITGNQAALGGGIVIDGDGTVDASNTVVCNNTAGTAAADVYSAGNGAEVILPDALGMDQIFAADGKNHKINGWFEDTEDQRYEPSADAVRADVSKPVTEEKYLIASYDFRDQTPITPESAAYQVDHYLQQDGGSYQLEETEFPLYGKIGETVYAVPKSYEGYSVNPTLSVMSGEVRMPSAKAEPDYLILSVYYDKKKEPDPTDPEEKTGNLKISKTVSGNKGDTSRSFPFQVTLDDDSVDGTYGDLTFYDGTAVFSLKHGESVTAKKLPAGVHYAVEEVDPAGYTVLSTDETGTIEDGETAVAKFTNHKSGSSGGNGGGSHGGGGNGGGGNNSGSKDPTPGPGYEPEPGPEVKEPEETAETDVTVETKAPSVQESQPEPLDTLPRTGDETNVNLWLWLMGLSGIVLFLTGRKLRRR